MMQVQINQITRRYFMPSSEQVHKDRLDHLTEQLFREYLDVAMEQSGCRSSDILCIRYLHCPICFESGKTDIDLFQQWLAQLVHSLQKLFAKPDDTVWLRFPSQIEALKSVGRSVAVNQLAHCWAWQQIGIISQPNLSLHEVKNQWLAYLGRNPQWAQAVFTGLAKEGTFDQLIQAKILIAGDLLLVLQTLSDVSDMFLLNAIDWSDLAQKLSNVGPRQVQPTFGRNMRHPSEVDVYRLKGLWAVLYPNESLTNCVRLSPLELLERIQVLSMLLLFTPKQRGYRGLGSSTNLFNHLYAVLTTAASLDTDAISRSVQTNLKQSNILASQQQRYEQRSFTNTTHLVEGEGAIAPVISHFGGLLFVFNILNQAAWRTELHNLLTSISAFPETILERLAIHMLPEIKDDPVLAIFCGTVFDPTQVKNKASAGQQNLQVFDQQGVKQIADFAQQLVDTIVNLFDPIPAIPNHHRFLQLCQRTVRIESQPGWVNVFFSMDSIETRVRAVGLDLDPDFLPWLGYVVKFYYE
jgi:hypothetical protein